MNIHRARAYVSEMVDLGTAMTKDRTFLHDLAEAGSMVAAVMRSGNKVLTFGNGGSATQAQHLSAELVGRFQKKRRAIPAIALTSESAILTAQANDCDFETVFSRQIEAYCQKGDLLIGLTTSDADKGNRHSLNVANAFQEGRSRGARSIGLVSTRTKELLPLIDIAIKVPGANTALVQVGHLHIIHFLCVCAEEAIQGM